MVLTELLIRYTGLSNLVKISYVLTPIVLILSLYFFLVFKFSKKGQSIMNKIVLNYLLKNFLKKFLIIIFIAYCFGLILNLFEEIENFKNMEVSIFTPLHTYKYFYSKYNYQTFAVCNFHI